MTVRELARRALIAVLAAGALGVAAAPAPAQQKPKKPNDGKPADGKPGDGKKAELTPWEAALEKYQAWVVRPSLNKRTKGREALAATNDPRALEILSKSYKKPEAPAERVAALIASITTAGCTKFEFLPRYAEWRAAEKKPVDAWLWYRSLQLNARWDDLDAIAKAVKEAPSIWLRAAAIQGFAPQSPRDMTLPMKDAEARLDELRNEPRMWSANPAVVALIPGLLNPPLPKVEERAINAQSCAALLLQMKPHRSKPEFELAANAVIAQLDDPALPAWTKLVISRYLARLMDKDGVPWVNGEPWRRELLAKGWTRKKVQDDTRYGVTFAGIPASGTRLCYVIDLSDSMLTKVTSKEKIKGVVTGEKRASDSPPLPWDKINTRFDLARELLLASIRQLTPEKSFCVVVFGTQAMTLESTPGLVVATHKAVEKVTAELEAIKPGGPGPDRPLGTLMGNTNLHGGLDRAFRVSSKGLDAKGSYVDPELLSDGSDTIFVFSDGDPTWDDYDAVDGRDPEDVVGDPESRTPHAGTPSLHFPGPYSFQNHLVEDVRRMNLFRGVEIHCVGTGEVTMEMLQKIASAGLGTAKQIGKDG